MNEISKHIITFTTKYEYPSSVLEEKNLNSSVNLALKDLKEDLKKYNLEEILNISVEVVSFTSKKKFKTKFEKQLFDYLFEQELQYQWGISEISFEKAPFLYEENGIKLQKTTVITIQSLQEKVLNIIDKIKKRD